MGPLRSDYLDVMGNTNLGDLTVNGSVQVAGPEGSLFGVYRQGAVINDMRSRPEGLLSVESPAAFQNNLEVKGSTSFEGSTSFGGDLGIDYVEGP